jgi:hypothetical protein
MAAEFTHSVSSVGLFRPHNAQGMCWRCATSAVGPPRPNFAGMSAPRPKTTTADPTGRVVAITGASRGIGRELALLRPRWGANKARRSAGKSRRLKLWPMFKPSVPAHRIRNEATHPVV